MFFAHLPVNYLCARAAASVAPASWLGRLRKVAFWAFLVGGVLPDLDLLYGWLVDRGKYDHHYYWTHLPIFWTAVLFVAGLAYLWVRNVAVAAGALALGAMVHLILDTAMGGIAWFYPASTELYQAGILPPSRSPWWWRFVFNWAFALEVTLTLAALIVFALRRRGR